MMQLTEEETEYNVTAVKHIFDAHIVLQFNCTNSITEQILEDVSITVDLSEAVRISARHMLAASLQCVGNRPFAEHSCSVCLP